MADIKDEIDIVEQFQREWAAFKHDEVLHAIQDSQYRLKSSLYFEVGDLQVRLWLYQGKRGGLGMGMWVTDPSKPVTADRLVVEKYDGLTMAPEPFGMILSDRIMDEAKNKPVQHVFEESLLAVMRELQEDPAQGAAKLLRIRSTSESLPRHRKLAGGSPGLGRRYGRK